MRVRVVRLGGGALLVLAAALAASCGRPSDLPGGDPLFLGSGGDGGSSGDALLSIPAGEASADILTETASGETITSKRTATGLHADVYMVSGSLGFSVEVVTTPGATPNFTWTTPDGKYTGSYTLDDPEDSTLYGLNRIAFQLFHDVQEAVTGTITYDSHGCDGPLPFLTCSPLGHCCDYHDACYHNFNCTAKSWLGSDPTCQACNLGVVYCMYQSAEKWATNPLGSLAGSLPSALGGGGLKGSSNCCSSSTCGQPWCYNTAPYNLVCPTGQCCDSTYGVCAPTGTPACNCNCSPPCGAGDACWCCPPGGAGVCAGLVMSLCIPTIINKCAEAECCVDSSGGGSFYCKGYSGCAGTTFPPPYAPSWLAASCF